MDRVTLRRQEKLFDEMGLLFIRMDTLIDLQAQKRCIFHMFRIPFDR